MVLQTRPPPVPSPAGPARTRRRRSAPPAAARASNASTTSNSSPPAAPGAASQRQRHAHLGAQAREVPAEPEHAHGRGIERARRAPRGASRATAAPIGSRLGLEHARGDDVPEARVEREVGAPAPEQHAPAGQRRRDRQPDGGDPPVAAAQRDPRRPARPPARAARDRRPARRRWPPCRSSPPDARARPRRAPPSWPAPGPSCIAGHAPAQRGQVRGAAGAQGRDRPATGRRRPPRARRRVPRPPPRVG